MIPGPLEICQTIGVEYETNTDGGGLSDQGEESVCV